LTRAKNVSEDWYVLSALSLNEKLIRLLFTLIQN